MAERKEGYYWVKYLEEWYIMYYEKEWFYSISDGGIRVKDVDEIDENQIIRE